MDQQAYRNSLSPAEPQNLEEFLQSPTVANMSYTNATAQEGVSRNIWNSVAPSSSEHPHAEGNHDEAKMDDVYTTSLTCNRGGALRIGGTRSEAVNTCSLGTSSLNLNNCHINDSQQYSQSSTFGDLPHNLNHKVGHVGTSSQTQEAGLRPQCITRPLESELSLYPDRSSVTQGTSSRGFGDYSGNGEGRSGSSLDGWRASKRKHDGGVSEHESAGGSSSLFRQNENTTMHSTNDSPNSSSTVFRSSDLLSGSESAAHLNVRIGTSTGVVTSDFPSDSLSGNTDAPQRVVRRRINAAPMYETPPSNLWIQGNTTPVSREWSPDQSSLPAPYQSAGSRIAVTGASSPSVLNVPDIPSLSRNVQQRFGAPSRRVGSSPNNPIILSERPVSSGEQINSSSIPRTNSLEISASAPAPQMRQLPLPQMTIGRSESVIPAPHTRQPIPQRGSSRHDSVSPAPQIRQPLPQGGPSRYDSVTSAPQIRHPLPQGGPSRHVRFNPAPHNRQQLPERFTVPYDHVIPAPQISQPLPERFTVPHEHVIPAPQISQPLPERFTGGHDHVIRAPQISQPLPQIFDIPVGGTSIPELFVPAPHVTEPFPPFFGLPNINAGRSESIAPAPRASTSLRAHHLLGPGIAPHQIPAIRHPRSFSEAIRRSLLNASTATYQAAGVAPQRPIQSATLQDIGHPSGTGLQGHPQAPVRSQTDTQRVGVAGIPVTIQGLAAAREGRTRMISEDRRTGRVHGAGRRHGSLYLLEFLHLTPSGAVIMFTPSTQLRNALELLRRGDNVHLEDFFLDHAFFHGGADLLDRHRDMRLDVDRMSYEELLALEERIGDVNTGLSEEIIKKCLKQKVHISFSIEGSNDAEPCCICQEQYADGEDVGILDCGHDFHADCIKQWLMQKNLCPICKTTALMSAGK